jgi:PTS IIA-like nitrogen-regulatory protein PtsN
MTLRISGKHMDIGDAFRTRIEARIADTIAKYFDGGYAGHVTVSKSGARFSADCMIHLDSGAVLQATSDAHEPTMAFDGAAERLEKRMRRYKRRLKSRSFAAADGASDIAYTIVAPVSGDDDEEVPEDYAPAIVAESTMALKTMSVASAVIELDTKESPVFVFRNAGNEHVNIVYRRSDGNIGWIDPSTSRAAQGCGLSRRGRPRGSTEDFSMDLSDLVQVPAILPTLKANSKKQLLQLLSERAAAVTGLPEREIFDTILQRERLGSTGVGNGIAIPHGKLAGVKQITGVFARLEHPVDFESLDDQPVDLVFLLLAPEGAGADHLKALSRIARVLRDGDTVRKVRGTRDASAIHSLLATAPASHAA